MGALLGVGQGSERESPAASSCTGTGAGRRATSAPLAFVGKGVTFDTGGISIKPAAGMEDMKWDMAGAGAVIGAMQALAARKAKVNVVGVVGLVENMPSGTAQRPGDIVKSMSGQTIEVHQHRRRGPARARRRALVLPGPLQAAGDDRSRDADRRDHGRARPEHAGLFANNDELADRLLAAGKAVGEQLWRMPLGEAYDKMINSDIADVKNIGGRCGGSITAAQFLQRFVNGHAVGASRHRRHGLVREGHADRAEGRHGLRRAAARPLRRGQLRGEVSLSREH